jgi:hypothetical protein
VSEIFNNFFINVAKDIGSSNIKSDESHPSISEIGFATIGFAIF